MIVLLEPVCHSWMHEEVNAGLLKLVRESCDEDVVYIGEKEHVICVSKLFQDSGVKYQFINDFKIIEDLENYKYVMYYFQMLNKIIHKYKVKNLFVTCAYTPCILATELISRIYSKCNINIILHGMVEKYKGKERTYQKLLLYSRYCSNIKFLSYSPFCTAEYWHIPSDKMCFIHHPYIKAKASMKKDNHSEKKIIGIIGACANKNAVRLVNLINHMDLKNDYEFWIASRFVKDFRGLSHVKILNQGFDRKNIEKIMKEIDYLLLPYGKKEYMLSASGVLWDAISNEIPCIMLDSKYFEYYQAYNIGYQAKSISELAEIIRQIITYDNNSSFFHGLEKLDIHNLETMRKLLNVGENTYDY